MSGEYRLEKLKPVWPTFSLLDVGEFDGGITESWSAARLRTWNDCYGNATSWKDWCSKQEANDFQDDPRESVSNQLMFGTTHLPEDLLRGAHKKLFGATTDCPSCEAIWTIGNALFTPQYPCAYKDNLSFRIWCNRQQDELNERNRVKSVISDLLTELDT